ncbi:MAG: glycosyltransferase family 4 protein, partial [Patescibacteria group bacterium]
LATERYVQSEGADVHTSFVDHIHQAGVQWNPLRNIWIRRVLGKNADTVFAVSATLKRALDAHKIPRVEVLPNGTEMSLWQAKLDVIAAFQKKHDLNGHKVIFFGGRLSRDKGSAPLLAALRMIRQTIPEAVLLVIGDAARLQGLIVEAGAEDLLPHVRCAGWLSQEEMAAAYGAADVVTTPSLCLDTFNLINIEAMSAGKPVVGTIFGGTPEIVVDGVTGYVRNPLKLDSYASALAKLLFDSSLAQKMGEAGRKRVEENYALKPFVARQIEAYGK